MSTLITAEQRKQLLANGAASATDEAFDAKPVVKLFGGGACTWLLSELDPSEPDRAFGLCDLGQGSPEMGSVLLSELEALKFPPFNLGVERDRHFTADRTLASYAALARVAGRITV